MTIFIHELKRNQKILLIWSFCVGILCFGCLLLFGGLEDTMEQMAEGYSQMGTLSEVLGLDRLSIATMEGFYATEISLMFAIGGAMFSAMTGAALLAKEEEGHTAEFLYTLPLGRTRIVLEKYASFWALTLLFHVICAAWILAGLLGAGESLPCREFLTFHGLQLLMDLEIGSICFLISAYCRKKPVGAALGIAILLYAADLMCRILPDLENLKYVTPYYFSNGADIFTGIKINTRLLGLHAAIMAAAAFSAVTLYRKKDLSA